MSDQLNSAFMDDPEFQSLMIQCMEALRSGASIDREALQKEFPKYADDLDRYLGVLKVLDQFSGGVGNLNSSSDPYGATITPQSGGPVDLEAGDTIHYIGEYEVLEEIARGGMGVVFKARQQTLKRIVALKMILSGRLADTAEIDRFRREAQAASRLQHPNIVAVHEIGEHEGRQYFTMDYVAGHSLAQEIREESLSPKRAARLVKTVAEAVDFAHQNGTLHRDLKPANVLLTSNDTPHVTDFGLAKFLDEVDDESRAELTASGQILGTPSYMSPEQAEGKQSLIGPPTDIYSLGAILYACLTGRAPFVADSPVDTLMQVIHKEPVSARQLNPAVPKDLETICMKCLSKEPHRRYGTPQELADDLTRFLEGRPVMARPLGLLARTWRWSKRNRPIAYLSGIILLLLWVGFVGTVVFAVRVSLMAQAERDAKYVANERAIVAEELRREAQNERERADDRADDANNALKMAESQLTMRERALYALQLSRSHEQWRFQPQEAREGLLNETRCPRHLNDFSWRFLERLTDRFERTYPGQHAGASSVAVSPDGKLFASCALDAKIQVCSSVSAMAWEMDRSPERWVNRVTFLPDNRTLVSGGDDSVVTAWDALSGKKLREAGHGEAVIALAASPDGKWIASGGKRQIRLFQASEMRQIREYSTGAGELVFAPDSRTLIAGSGRSVVFLQVDADEQQSWDGHQSGITGLAVSPDGKRLVSCDSKTLLVRKMEDGDILHRISEPLNAEFKDVQFSPDGKTFATAAGVFPVKLWNAETGEAVGAVTPYLGTMDSLAFLPNGSQLLTPGSPPNANLKLWNLPAVELATTVQQKAFWMAASSDNDLLATTNRFYIQIWDSPKKEVIQTWIPERTDQLEGPIGKLQFLSGSRQLLSMHEKNCVALWDLDTKRLVRRFENLGRGRAFAYDPVHNRMAVPNPDQKLSVRDFETGEEIMSFGKIKQTLQSAAFSPDGNWIAFSSGLDPLPDGTPTGQLQLWNLKTGESLSLEDSPRRSVYDLAFSPNGKTLVAVGQGGTMWDLPSGKVVGRLEGHQSTIWSVDFSADGRTLVTGSMDKSIRLWDPVTSELRLTLEGHLYWVTAVEFNHDGTQLVSCSYDGQIKFWDADRSHISSKMIQFHPLVGEWVIQKLDVNGQKKTEQDDKEAVIRFSQKKFHAECLGLESISYHSNHKITPAIIDLKFNREGKTVRSRGIYKLDDDTLTLVIADERLPRPKEFTPNAPENSNVENPRWFHLVLKRKLIIERTTTDVTQPLEVPQEENPGKPDTPKIQMKPAPVLTLPQNSSIPLVTTPGDSKDNFKLIKAWIEQLDSNSPSQRRRAFNSLTEAGPKALPAYFRLVKFLDGKDSYEKGLAIDCLGSIGSNAAEVVPQLHEILKDKGTSYVLRFKAVRAMSRMGKSGEVAIPTLIGIVKDPGPSEKQRLKEGTAPEALGLMAPLFRKDEEGGFIDQRDQMLSEAINALGHFGPQAGKAIPVLR